jgi:hypothetical protein
MMTFPPVLRSSVRVPAARAGAESWNVVSARPRLVDVASSENDIEAFDCVDATDVAAAHAVAWPAAMDKPVADAVDGLAGAGIDLALDRGVKDSMEPAERDPSFNAFDLELEMPFST